MTRRREPTVPVAAAIVRESGDQPRVAGSLQWWRITRDFPPAAGTTASLMSIPDSDQYATRRPFGETLGAAPLASRRDLVPLSRALQIHCGPGLAAEENPPVL